jgi:hypothetical protein
VTQKCPDPRHELLPIPEVKEWYRKGMQHPSCRQNEPLNGNRIHEDRGNTRDNRTHDPRDNYDRNLEHDNYNQDPGYNRNSGYNNRNRDPGYNDRNLGYNNYDRNPDHYDFNWKDFGDNSYNQENSGNGNYNKGNPGYRYNEEPESGYGTSLATLEKMYKEDYKYSGRGDNFSYKLGIFDEICMKANVPLRHRNIAYSTMLRGAALDYYHTNLKEYVQTARFEDLTQATQNHFKSKEYQGGIMEKWLHIMLEGVMERPENSGKSTIDCL